MEVAIKNVKEKARRIYSQPKEGQKPLELQTLLQDIFESRFLLGEPIPDSSYQTISGPRHWGTS